LETLAGIAAQSRAAETILVVDNASTDGTASAVEDAHPSVEILRLVSNTGSAGGFGAGAAWAFEHGYDWIWLLDNDSIPKQEALARLIAAHRRFPKAERPILLASKVVWIDGSILPLNVPIIKRKNLPLLYLAAQYATLSLRAAPYAGILVHRSVVERHGLPLKDYFLWEDDIEWTGRILRDGFGVLVPDSVVCHKTPSNPSTTADAGPRFYYEIRNKIWMLRYSDAYRPMEKLRFALTLVVDTFRFLKRQPVAKGVSVVVRGLLAGGLKRPGYAGGRHIDPTAAEEPSL
jgi:GT2 family glycosyltransferase